MDAVTLRFECLQVAAGMCEGRSKEEIIFVAEALFQWCIGAQQPQLRAA